MRLLRDSWDLSSPNPVACVSCFSLPWIPAFGSCQLLSSATCHPSCLLPVLSRQQGGFRGMDPNPVALSENFGSTSMSLTESSLLVLLEQNYLNGFHSFADGPHNHLCNLQISQWQYRVEGGTNSLVY